MTPDFALHFSEEGIALEERGAGGWQRLARVALDSTTFAADMSALRDTGEAAADARGAEFVLKLVLPDTQLKFLTLEDDAATSEAIARALEGATPYALNEMAFDWQSGNGTTRIVAVARETLAEAEGFAMEHDLRPVAFVALPAEGWSGTEAFLGRAGSGDGPLPVRDPLPYRRVAGEAAAEAAEAAAPVELETVEAETVAAEAVVAEAPVSGEPVSEGPASEEPVSVDAVSKDPGTPAGEAEVPADEAAETSIEASPVDAPAFADADDAGADPAPEPAQHVTPPADPQPEPAALAEEEAAPPPLTATPPRTEPTFQTVRRPQSGAAPTLGSALRGPANTAAPAVSAGVAPLSAPAARPPAASAPTRAETAAATPDARTLAASLRPTPDAQPLPDDPLPELVRESQLDSQPMSQPMSQPGPKTALDKHFGQPKPKKGPPPKRIGLGLILTLLLILGLLGVAAVAAVDRDAISRLFERAPTELAAAPELPEIAPPPLEDAEGIGAAPRGPEVSAEEAAAQYEATGIWIAAPPPLTAPLPTNIDSFYVTSIDSDLRIGDAFALTLPETLDADRRMAAQPLPPAFGTRFRFGPDGLLLATPEGARSPQGYTVFAGRPPAVPPLRIPERTEAPEAEGAAGQVPRLAAFRPRPRPDTLAETTERGLLGGLTRSELAAFRPKPRPATRKAIAEAEAEAAGSPRSEFAVAASLRPVSRPANFARIVAEARASQPSTVAVAAPVAPRVTAPAGPTRASVARAATLDRAINLRRVNLLGVTGKPSNRSALVRLANGRIVKVQVGDSMDGGRVAAIGESALRYVKRGRNITLEMPAG